MLHVKIVSASKKTKVAAAGFEPASKGLVPFEPSPIIIYMRIDNCLFHQMHLLPPVLCGMWHKQQYIRRF